MSRYIYVLPHIYIDDEYSDRFCLSALVGTVISFGQPLVRPLFQTWTLGL